MDYPYHYQLCLNISYNEEGTPGLGSGIFLHCLGPAKPFTGGSGLEKLETAETIAAQIQKIAGKLQRKKRFVSENKEWVDVCKEDVYGK